MKFMNPVKRLITVFLAIVLVCLTTACGSAPDAREELQHKFPEYYDLNTFKGLEVYVWQTAKDTYYCGVLPGTNSCLWGSYPIWIAAPFGYSPVSAIKNICIMVPSPGLLSSFNCA